VTFVPIARARGVRCTHCPGDLVLSEGTRLFADVWGRKAGTEYDQVLCSGTASVSGAVLVLNAGNSSALFPPVSAPTNGQAQVPRAALFPVLLANAVSGKFASTLNPSKEVGCTYGHLYLHKLCTAHCALLVLR
jgi:hypothetical protein